MARSSNINDVFTFDFIEKEIYTIQIKELDLIPRAKNLADLTDTSISSEQDLQLLTYDSDTGYWTNKYLSEIINEYLTIETPTVVTSVRYQLSQNAISGTLKVYLNGIKERYITIINANTFEFEVAPDSGDIIQAEYYHQP